MQTAFDMTVQWAFDRYTFGRPIASYQALKHRFADMKAWLEASHAIADAAAAAVQARSPQAGELVGAAKAFIGEYGTDLMHECVQLHGGIGLTFELDLHLFLRRATLNRVLYGTPAEHRRRVGEPRWCDELESHMSDRVDRQTSSVPQARTRRGSATTSVRSSPGEISGRDQPSRGRRGTRRRRPRPEAPADALRRGARGDLHPEGVRGPGPHPCTPAGAQQGARRVRVPDPCAGADLHTLLGGPPRLRDRGAETASRSADLEG